MNTGEKYEVQNLIKIGNFINVFVESRNCSNKIGKNLVVIDEVRIGCMDAVDREEITISSKMFH